MKVLSTLEMLSELNTRVNKDEKTIEYLTKLKPALMDEYESFIEHLNIGLGCCKSERWSDSYGYYGIAISERDKILNAFENIEVPSGSDVFSYIHNELNEKLDNYTWVCANKILDVISIVGEAQEGNSNGRE